MQRRRNGRAATRFVRKLLKQQQRSPNRLVTDKLARSRVAHRAERASVPHDTTPYANNRIEASHRRTRVRERPMLRFRSAGNRFLSVQASILNLFNWGRHRLRAKQYRCFRARAFDGFSVFKRPLSKELVSTRSWYWGRHRLRAKHELSLLSIPSVRRGARRSSTVVGNSWISSRTRLATCRCLVRR